MDEAAPVLVKCPNCGAQFIAVLRDDAPEKAPICVECDALLPPVIEGRYLYEIVPTWFD